MDSLCTPTDARPGSGSAAAQRRQRAIIDRLAQRMGAEDQAPQRFETHISWVLVAGGLAYKFKKALRFDVLDYSTLARRLACCEQELRLNRAFSPVLYLGVVAVTGSETQPVLGGGGPVLEYAVQMRAFPQQALWSARLRAGELGEADIDALAQRLAQLHRAATVAPAAGNWAAATRLHAAGRQDLATLAALLAQPWAARQPRVQVRALQCWHDLHAPPAALLERRRATSAVRACHGDLHLDNILTLDGRIELFDCIEFNDALRWIDVMNDLGFPLMELRFHAQDALAARLLGRYLEASGDYAGLAVLGYYQAMRALARCKVWLLRAGAATPDEAAAMRQTALRYLELAVGLSSRRIPARGAVVILHGYSGCGKSSCAAALADAVGGVRVRSDLERKRLHGMAGGQHAPSAPRQGLYDRAANRATYARLLRLAADIAQAGLPAVVDAAFLRRADRRRFAELAQQLEVPFFIVDVQTPFGVLLERLERRSVVPDDASDAGMAVLAHQLMSFQRLTRNEQARTLVLDGATPAPLAVATAAAAIAAALQAAAVQA
jgi:aminoglycoside phosphotransferase family enzyme/predicted kinase